MAFVSVRLHSSVLNWTLALPIALVRPSGPHDSFPNCGPQGHETRWEIIGPIASARTGSRRGRRAEDHAYRAGCAIGHSPKAWPWFEIVNATENQMK